MTSPVFETAAQGTDTDATLTITKPTDTAENDLLIATMGSRTAAGSWSLAGWTFTQLGTSDAWAYKVAGASEPANYTFTYSGAVAGVCGGIIRISGADTTDPIAAEPTPATGGPDQAPDPPASGSVTSGDYLAVAIAWQDDDTGSPSSPPTNYTERIEVVIDATDDAWTSIATRELTGITSEDPGTFATDGTLVWYAATILVAPPSAGHYVAPTDDITTTGWTSTPLWSKIDDDPDSPDATVITATAS